MDIEREKRDTDKMTTGEKIGVGIFATVFTSLHFLAMRRLRVLFINAMRKRKHNNKH